MAKYFVTGGTGFLGRHVLARLAETPNEIVCLYHAQKPVLRKWDSVRWIKGDLLEKSTYEDVLKQADYVIHLAGLLSARRKQDFLRINKEGTAALLAACMAADIPLKRFVHMSSIAVNGPNREGRLLKEADVCFPQSEYGKSKQQAEQVVLEHADRLPVVILRPTFVFGRGDLRGLKFLLSFKEPAALSWASRIKSVCLCHVSDVAQGCLLSLEDHVESGDIFIISDPGISSWGDILDGLEGALSDLTEGKGKERFKLTEAFRHFAHKFQSAMSQEGPYQFWACDVSRATNILGFSPEMPFRKGALDTLRWYLEQDVLHFQDFRRIFDGDKGP